MSESTSGHVPNPHLAGSRRDVLSQEHIDRLVDGFYGRVRRDPLLAPIFEGAIEDWGPHLATMKRFWAAVLLHQPGYRGNPPSVHRALDGVTARHFARWLFLFRLEVACTMPASSAPAVMGRAEVIASRLMGVMGIQTPSPAPGGSQ